MALSMQELEIAELVPVVTQIIDYPHIDRLEWEVRPVSGAGGSQMSGGLGIYRLIGSAYTGEGMYPWSVIVKSVTGSNSTGDPTGTYQTPSAWNYWKREILAYRSGILAALPGNLAAPRCYQISEHPNDEWRIWLEDIQEPQTKWGLAQHGITARHLGQFNGAYLAGQMLPAEEPWMYRGRARDWIKFAAPLLDQFQHYAWSEMGQRWLTSHSVEQIQRLVENHQALLTQLARLPVCLCHHDAFRRNLMLRDRGNAEGQTIAIDWAMMGFGGVGEEVGITTAVALWWLEVGADQAKALDQIIFDSYVAGLRDAGWQGDVRLARFGYTTTAALVIGVAHALIVGVYGLSSDDGIRSTESTIGYKLDDTLAQWATIHPFLLDLGDEAVRLATALG